MTRKEKFMKLLAKHDYPSVNKFCIENNLQQTHFSTRLNDESIRVELKLLFQVASILHEPIDTILEIFYPEEMKENKKQSS